MPLTALNAPAPQGGDSLPDPRRSYSAPLFRGFMRYLKWYVRRHFQAVLLSCEDLPRTLAGRPLIIYTNHPSWWDPLMFALIGETIFPGRRGFGPMEALALERYAILKRFGAFGVDPASARGGLVFMIQARRVLALPPSILWLTAEGAFTDVRHRPVRLQPGLGYLARMAGGAVVLPLAVEYAFWNESRPVALCRFGAAIELDRPQTRPASEWQTLFERALSHTMDRLSRDVQRRDPTHFRSLLKGSSGVGGIYDGWRRLNAWRRGRRFNAAHEQEE